MSKHPNLIPNELKYDPSYCSQLIEHMSKGFSYESFGGVLSCGRNTLYEWEKRFPEWVKAKRIAFDKCQLFWETEGMSGMRQGSKLFNGAMWNFNMSARFKWSMKNESAVTVSRLEDLLGTDAIETSAHEVTPAIEHDNNTIEIESHHVENIEVIDENNNK